MTQTTKPCHFCSDRYAQERGPIPDGPLFITRYDTHPVGAGHTLITPTRHIAQFSGMNSEELQAIGHVIKDVVDAFAEGLPQSVIDMYKANASDPPTPKAADFANHVLRQDYLNDTPVDFSHGINDGPLAGQTIAHLHYHVIPRFKGDVDDPVFGIRTIFPPELANYK